MRLIYGIAGMLLLLTMLCFAGCEDEDHGHYGYGYGGGHYGDGGRYGGHYEGHRVAYTHEYRGMTGPSPDAGYFVVQRPEVWNALWGGKPPADANVDFTKQSVIVAFMGQEPTTGYDIKIDNVLSTEKRINVLATMKQPDPKANMEKVQSDPYHMVVVPKITTPVYLAVAGAKGQPLAVQDLYEGMQCNMATPTAAVIRSADAWQNFWTKNIGATVPAPAVDFTQYTAVAVFAGKQATEGYAIHVTAATQVNENLVINYRLKSPQPGETVAQNATSPYSIALVPANTLAVSFMNVQPPAMAAPATPATPAPTNTAPATPATPAPTNTAPATPATPATPPAATAPETPTTPPAAAAPETPATPPAAAAPATPAAP